MRLTLGAGGRAGGGRAVACNNKTLTSSASPWLRPRLTSMRTFSTHEGPVYSIPIAPRCALQSPNASSRWYSCTLSKRRRLGAKIEISATACALPRAARLAPSL